MCTNLPCINRFLNATLYGKNILTKNGAYHLISRSSQMPTGRKPPWVNFSRRAQFEQEKPQASRGEVRPIGNPQPSFMYVIPLCFQFTLLLCL